MGKALPLPPTTYVREVASPGYTPPAGVGGGREPSFPDVLGNPY